MQYKYLVLFMFLVTCVPSLFAQENDSTNFSIYYSSPARYTIADVEITGIKYLDKSVLIQLSGLRVGDEIDVPGEVVTNAIKKLWQQGLFSDVQITATKVVKDNIYISEDLTPSEAKAAYDLRCQRRAQRATDGELQLQSTRDQAGSSSTSTATRLVYRSTRSINQSYQTHINKNSNETPTVQQPPASSQHTSPAANMSADTANTPSAGRPIQRQNAVNYCSSVQPAEIPAQ